MSDTCDDCCGTGVMNNGDQCQRCRAEKAEQERDQLKAQVDRLTTAIYLAIEKATDTLWISNIGTLQDFMDKEQES